MTQFVAINPKAEVLGDAVLAVLEAGRGAFRPMMLDILASHHINDPKRGSWYLQQDWLDAFQAISEKIGEQTLFAIGTKIPESAAWPPDVDTEAKALGSIDVAFHMNHRIQGVALFDPTTGQMTEGIGHYGFELTGDKAATMVCDNPYPCAFDRGIIEAAAKKFATRAFLVNAKHDDSKECRNKGGGSCTYHVTW